MLRCASSLVNAAYVQVRLIPHASRALPAELFTVPSKSRVLLEHFCPLFPLVKLAAPQEASFREKTRSPQAPLPRLHISFRYLFIESILMNSTALQKIRKWGES
jgi:hypothetical protein